MAHHATDVHQWLSATGALLDEDTSLWLSPGDDPADGGLLVGSNGDTYYMPPDTARKLDDTVKEENLSGQTLGEKLWSFLTWWRQENPVDDAPVSPGQ
uniref:Uncharacterized protein n=1 Tax=Triticum urartu TaxID=4572 RepID=A0A8R7P996_TRIUA